MPRYAVAGNSYIEVDDAGGTPRDLSPYVDDIGPLGKEASSLLVSGINDAAQRVIAGTETPQELTLRGVFDDNAGGPDEVLSGIVGLIGTVSYGPAGKGPGQRKITGEFLCLGYQVISRVGHQVRFQARFQQDGAISITTWA